MRLISLEGCRLAIGSYPPFYYDARGGGGIGIILPDGKDNIKHIKFKPERFSIPPLSSKTTKFLSLPLPPGLKIEILMDKLEGTIDKDSGKVLLRFESRFIFSIGYIYSFPYLSIKTFLQTGEVKGKIHEEEGLALQKDGTGTLIAISVIPKTGNKILDIFLGLPNEALAVLRCKIEA
tara:strand:- start:374 stop:907 length:534 start_codon:yes stop_codon:yes gene_type:complete